MTIRLFPILSIGVMAAAHAQTPTVSVSGSARRFREVAALSNLTDCACAVFRQRPRYIPDRDGDHYG
jgi:hypothetical protein